MISVAEAERIILSAARDFGTEEIPFTAALGRTLARDLLADRDFPPFNRVTMDGIAIAFRDWEQGMRDFTITATQAAGDAPLVLTQPGECIEIMTGAALPPTADTVISYEELQLQRPRATIAGEVKQGQNIHVRGRDRQQNDVLVPAGTIITPAIVGLAAATGATRLLVRKLPRVAVFSTGDELVSPEEVPLPAQIRRSNDFTIAAVLQQRGIETELVPLGDDPAAIRQALSEGLQNFDAVLLSGGVSMGRFDHVPGILKELGVEQLFHRIRQRPGKPFLFGQKSGGATVFAFPGNPVSTFLCLHRYFLPWLNAGLGLATTAVFAVLDQSVTFEPPLHYFLQVRLTVSNDGRLTATPAAGNGSGDFVNLASAQAFLELPADQNNFEAGSVHRVWPFGPLV